MKLQRLHYLIQRRLEGTLTDAETRELEQAAIDMPEAVVEIMTAMMEDMEQEEPMGDDAMAERFRAIMEVDRPQAAVPEKRRRLWPYVSVAAAVAVVAASVYLLRTPHKQIAPVSPAMAAVKPAIIPGGNKAVLTLANGQQIVLDSAEKGSLAQQGGVQVMKLDSGLLSYQGSQTAGTAITYNVLSTPRGGQYQLVLPDGTHVWLNSASSLRYPTAFSGSREVELTGEAYFEVAKKAGAAFTVHTQHSLVEVLGTAFNLMAYPDEHHTQTTLINGSVKVTQGSDSRLIMPGEQAAVDNQSGNIAVGRPDLEEVVAWKDGRFQFGNTDLKTIMRQVARWYDVDVEYRRNIDSIYFAGGISRKQYASQLLELLEMDGRVHFIIEGKKIIVQ